MRMPKWTACMVFSIFMFISPDIVFGQKSRVPKKITKPVPKAQKKQVGKKNTVGKIESTNSSAPPPASGKMTIEENVDRKISLSPYVGVNIFPPDVMYNEKGLPRNLFGGLSPAPMFGITAYYRYKRRVNFGADANFFFTQRPINKMSALGVGLVAKINLLNPKNRFSPYILLGANVSFVNISQEDQIRTFVPTDTAIIGPGFAPQKIDYKYNDLSLTMVPMLGPQGGLGMDIKITKKISAFVQGNIYTNIGTNAWIKAAFPENESVMQYIAFKAGVNIKLSKRMRFDIDSEAVKIPDLIVMLTPPEGDEQDNQQMLSREANFAVNLREGLKHNVQISTNSGEINLEVEQDNSKSPCPVKAILYDQFGNKVAEQFPGADGKVNFSGLDKGVFNVEFEVQPPCKEAAISYAVTDADAEIVKQHNTEYTTATRDSLKYNIEGFVDFKDADASKENVQVMLVDQNDKKVKSRVVTKTDGGFSFKNLTPGNYRVVYDVGNPNVQSKINYDIKTNTDSLVKKVDFPFLEKKNNNKEGSRLMAGKLEMADPSIAAYKVNLDLVDKYNRVIDKSVPNQDGSFAFIDKKSDENDIIYDLADKKIADKPLVKSMTYEPKVEENKRIAALEPKQAKLSEAKLEINIPEMEMYKLYDRAGQMLNVEGFGFQVGAFRNMTNVHQLMDKLKSEGFEVFVQSLMSTDINSRFKSSQNYKIHRVIVFGTNEDNKATQIRGKLVEEGYPIIVKEHFKPSAKKE